MIKNKLYKTVMTFAVGMILTLPVFAEGFSTKKIKIPFEPKLELKTNKVNIKSKTDLIVSFKIDEGSYLYKDSLSVKVDPVEGIKVGNPVFPKAEKKLDKFTNQQKEIYHNSFTIKLPVEITDKAKAGKIQLSSTVGFQGCSKTICYIPQEKQLSIPIEIIKKK